MYGWQMYLEEDFADDAICLLAEHGGEDDGDTILGGLDVYGFLVAVVDLHELSLAGAGGVESFLRLEGALEGRSEGVALEECEILDERITRLCFQ